MVSIQLNSQKSSTSPFSGTRPFVLNLLPVRGSLVWRISRVTYISLYRYWRIWRKNFNVGTMSEMNAVDTLYCHGRIMSAEGFPCVNCPDFDPRKGCALVGSPNVPYWKSIGVSFTKSFNLDGIIEHNEANNWSKLDHHEIIALPASFMRFPSTNVVNYVHKSLVFVDEIKTIGDKGKCNLTFIIYIQSFLYQLLIKQVQSLKNLDDSRQFICEMVRIG